MDLQEQYERILGMKQTPEVVTLRSRLEVFIHKSRHLDLLADQLYKQVRELERMCEELDNEEGSISKMISKLSK